MGFRYWDKNNHLVFEVHGGVDSSKKLCRLRKSFAGEYQTIAIIEENCGYDIGKWTTLIIRFSDKKG